MIDSNALTTSDQSLCVADKASFHNCLVAMRPNATKAILPSTHDVTTYIHNAFSAFINSLRDELQVSTNGLPNNLSLIFIQSSNAGHVSTMVDMWSVEQTKVSFMGITAHWIHADSTAWDLRSKVVGFRAVSGQHTGENLAHYFVALCKHAGIIPKTNSSQVGPFSLHTYSFHSFLSRHCPSSFVSPQTMQVTTTGCALKSKTYSTSIVYTCSTQTNIDSHASPTS